MGDIGRQWETDGRHWEANGRHWETEKETMGDIGRHGDTKKRHWVTHGRQAGDIGRQGRDEKETTETHGTDVSRQAKDKTLNGRKSYIFETEGQLNSKIKNWRLANINWTTRY
jgi:hypothetical protein